VNAAHRGRPSCLDGSIRPAAHVRRRDRHHPADHRVAAPRPRRPDRAPGRVDRRRHRRWGSPSSRPPSTTANDRIQRSAARTHRTVRLRRLMLLRRSPCKRRHSLRWFESITMAFGSCRESSGHTHCSGWRGEGGVSEPVPASARTGTGVASREAPSRRARCPHRPGGTRRVWVGCRSTWSP